MLGQVPLVLVQAQPLSQAQVSMQSMVQALVQLQVLEQAPVLEKASAQVQPKTLVRVQLVLAQVWLAPQGLCRWPAALAARAALEVSHLPAEDLKFHLPALERHSPPVGTCLVAFQQHSLARCHRAPQLLVLERWKLLCH